MKNNSEGLSDQEAMLALQKFGYNELPAARPKNVWHIAREVMREPMFVLLIGCGTLYLMLGDYKEGVILMSSIFLIIGITFYQYRKTERALEALKELSAPKAIVIRNGVQQKIPGRELVPDDIIIVAEGDRVPADANIISSLNLFVDESMLTGESMPVLKNASLQEGVEKPESVISSGTMVVQGKATAKVIRTGVLTAVGKIGTSISLIKDEPTALQKEMKKLIRRLGIIGIVISISVVIVYFISRDNFIQSLLVGLSASMAILPEEFPVIITVFLALGAWRLSQIHVLVRKPAAMEALGWTTVLCSDKTGTITQNKMEVKALFTVNKILSCDEIDPSDEKTMQLILHSNRASQFNSADPMEQAIKSLFDRYALANNNPVLIKEYPLSRQLLAMARVYRVDGQKELIVSVKGAPEAIAGLCQLDVSASVSMLERVEEMAGIGYRVLGVASCSWEEHIPLPEEMAAFPFSFIGLIGLEDPVRKEVPEAVQDCIRAGIRIIMITGDYPVTAKSIAGKIGLPVHEKIITGDELNEMDDATLSNEIRHINIFARVVPEQKLRIVQALKSNGEIVAMTGDGINDAPALKAAHVGISMGNKGTDVAREASSLVITDDNFASIVSGIRYGRRIFDNLQKAMSYVLAIHIPIIGLTLIPAFFPALPLILLPLHIVFMELIIDPVCSIAFEAEGEERGVMKRKPRSHNRAFFGGRQIVYSLLQGALLLMVVLSVYFIALHEQHSEGEVRAISFTALIIGNIFLILTNLSKTRSFLDAFTQRNYIVIFVTTAAILLLIMVISNSSIASLFGFEYPGLQHFIISLSGAGLLLFILEMRKYFRWRIRRKHFHDAEKKSIPV